METAGRDNVLALAARAAAEGQVIPDPAEPASVSLGVPDQAGIPTRLSRLMTNQESDCASASIRS
jgi:hypothetical protein